MCASPNFIGILHARFSRIVTYKIHKECVVKMIDQLKKPSSLSEILDELIEKVPETVIIDSGKLSPSSNYCEGAFGRNLISFSYYYLDGSLFFNITAKNPLIATPIVDFLTNKMGYDSFSYGKTNDGILTTTFKWNGLCLPV